MGSFRRHVHTRAGSARITPLWLSCSPNRTHLPGFEARNRIHGSWFTGGPNQSIEVGQFRVSNSRPNPKGNSMSQGLVRGVDCPMTFYSPAWKHHVATP